jgi:hypothetical protein
MMCLCACGQGGGGGELSKFVVNELSPFGVGFPTTEIARKSKYNKVEKVKYQSREATYIYHNKVRQNNTGEATYISQ